MPTDVTQDLNNLVADTTVLYMKIHNYHWNVKGPAFFTLHEKFEELYTELAGHLDVIAERILQLGHQPIGSLKQALEHAAICEETETIDAHAMVTRTLADLETYRGRTHAAITSAQSAGDRTTENILDDIIDSLAKHAWMFRAFLG